MTKDIIKLSALLLGLDDVVDYISANQPEAPSKQTQEKIDMLITYLNYILREITKEYYPLYHSEVISSDHQCQIKYTSFTYTPNSIKDIKNSQGDSVTFNLYPEFAKVGFPNANYLVEYSYSPNKISNLFNHLALPIGLEYFIICYGIASEYALSQLLYSEAEMWESKFRNGLKSFKSNKGERRFFARRLK